MFTISEQTNAEKVEKETPQRTPEIHFERDAREDFPH